jgi:alpha-beta hydrolase superfamily lysophospholipase
MNVLLMAGMLALLAPGLYRTATGASTYAGVEHELPDPPVVQSYDPATRRLVESPNVRQWRLVTPVHEQATTVDAPQGKLGVSLYYADRRKRAAIVLIHGNDPETREMGFIIPYLVANGIDVISYDQRGTGSSPGNWQRSGPQQRAADVDAIIDAFAANGLVDRKRIGVWGFSNGGWTAPIVATQRPIAFMILKSAPAESLPENIVYESKQQMLRHHEDTKDIASAAETWRVLLSALCDGASWAPALDAYRAAEGRAWFAHSLLPPALHLPLQGAAATGWRNFACYDPASTLPSVTTPTLALFGSRDRAVDVPHASRTLRADFAKAGMRDFTMRVFPGAAHTLVRSSDGFRADVPERYARGYPEIMIDWLARRGFLRPTAEGR